MDKINHKHGSNRFLSPQNLYEQIQQFTKGMAVTKGEFNLFIENCTFKDMEWNHMDQMHRPSIHHTYEKGIRIAFGKDYAISLTQWKNWPLFLTVTDVFVARGMYYQSMTIAGLIFLHGVISFKEDGQGVHLKNEWYIASRKFFKFLHPFLSKKLFNLNKRLQDEDAQIRHGRYALRQEGYTFKTDEPDYYNSNVVANNTIYPLLRSDAKMSLNDLSQELTLKQAGGINFIVKKIADQEYHIWPAACPHEGGPLLKGKACATQIVCPWHGLRFSPVHLSADSPTGARYGFEYSLENDYIHVRQTVMQQQKNVACLHIT